MGTPGDLFFDQFSKGDIDGRGVAHDVVKQGAAPGGQLPDASGNGVDQDIRIGDFIRRLLHELTIQIFDSFRLKMDRNSNDPIPIVNMVIYVSTPCNQRSFILFSFESNGDGAGRGEVGLPLGRDFVRPDKEFLRLGPRFVRASINFESVRTNN